LDALSDVGPPLSLAQIFFWDIVVYHSTVGYDLVADIGF